MIPFFRKNSFKEELTSLQLFYSGELINSRQSVTDYFLENFYHHHFLLTKSCTQSLELALMSLNLPAGKEVILPSFGFVSIANAAVLNGLKCVFVDCEPETMNISIPAVQNAITENTAAVVTINYAGVSCDYDLLKSICREKGIYLIEDNAHGIRAKYKGDFLGTFGDISTISFDFLKNVSCNEGGGISVNAPQLLEKFYQCYYFGTNRQDFLDKKVSFYEWTSVGTNASLAEHLSVILLAQLNKSAEIVDNYLAKWNLYYSGLKELEEEGLLDLAKIPAYAEHNGHIFWIKTKDLSERENLMHFLKSSKIETAFHYTPLHSSAFGRQAGEFRGEDQYTTDGSNRLLRLPLYYNLTEDEQQAVIDAIFRFYRQKQ